MFVDVRPVLPVSWPSWRLALPALHYPDRAMLAMAERYAWGSDYLVRWLRLAAPLLAQYYGLQMRSTDRDAAAAAAVLAAPVGLYEVAVAEPAMTARCQ